MKNFFKDDMFIVRVVVFAIVILIFSLSRCGAQIIYNTKHSALFYTTYEKEHAATVVRNKQNEVVCYFTGSWLFDIVPMKRKTSWRISTQILIQN